MKATTRNATKWLLSLVFALVVISLILIPQVLKVESQAYSRNTSWDYSSSTPHITSVPDLLQMVYLCDQGTTTFEGKTIYLDCDLDVNPGWDATVVLSSTSGKGLAASTGTVTLPSAPATNWTNAGLPNKGENDGSGYPNKFKGTFDGQNHTISGIRMYKDASQCREVGLLFNELVGTVRNLAIVNSTIIWNQNSGYGESGYGGVVGSVESTATLSNVYSEVTVVVCSNAHSKAAVGGIAGYTWGTMSQCAYIGMIVETAAQNNYTYPATVTTRHIGGLAGAGKGGSVTDCLAIPTFAVRESSKSSALSTTHSSTSGGVFETICAKKDDSNKSTVTRVQKGIQSSSPGSNWTDCRNQLGTYLPTGAANALGRANAGSTIHISTAEQLLQVVRAVDQGLYTYYGTTIYLDNDIDLNPGWSASVTLSGSTGMGLSASSGTVTLPSAPSTLWPNVGLANKGCGSDGVSNYFNGTFDGQGHTISGIYAYKNSGNSTRDFGILFNRVQTGTVRNLIITNSIIIENQNNKWGGPGLGGLVGAVINGTISNVYIEADMVWQSDQSQRYAIGGITGWQEGGTITNCIYKGKIIETAAADSLTYPSGKTSRHIGGVAGEVEGGTMTDCIGMPTFAVSESSVALQSTDQKTTTGGANLAVAGHYGSDYGTLTRVYEGARTSNPGNSYVDYTPTSIGSWVPSGLAAVIPPFLNGVSIDDYTFDESYFPGSWVTINSMSEFNTFRSGLYSSGSYGSGITFKLTTDLDFNPGWNSHPTVSGGKVTWPSNPGNFERIRNFYGTLDGQGHTISGIYAERNSSAVDGAFFWHFHGTLKNIAFTNSMVLYNRGTSAGGRGYGAGFIAGDAEGTFENIYLDVEVWAKANNNVALAVLAPNALGTTTVTNFTFRGRFAVADNSNNYNYSASGQNAQGLLFGNGYTKTITVNHALFDFECGAPNLLIDEGDTIMLVRYDRGGTTLNDVLTLSSQTSSRAGWTNQTSTIGTWTPGSAAPSKYVVSGSDLAIASFVSNANYYKPGTSFVIANYSQYNTFASKINADGSYGRGYVFKITNDFNVNSAWRATGEYDWDGSTGSIEFTSAPANVWPVLDKFCGTLDGQGHLLEGLYANYTTAGSQNKMGLLFKDLGTDASVKNLLIRNSRMIVHAGTADHYVGGIAAYVSGNDVLLQNIYLDLDLVIATWSGQHAGGFVGYTQGNRIKLDNLMFSGRMSMSRATSSNTYFDLPTTTPNGILSELVGNYNFRTTVYTTNIVLGGARYSSAAQLANAKWTGANNSDSTDYGTKSRYDLIILDTISMSKDEFDELAADEDWCNENLAGGYDNLYNYLTSADIFEAFAYSEKVDCIVPVGLASYLADATFHNFNPSTTSITAYTGSEITGSIFTIANASDLMYAVDLSQNGATFAGYTLMLTANIDLNPGWDGHVAVDGSAATLPSLPTNVFRGFKLFSGTFDGANYYIAGIFMMGTVTSSSFQLAPFNETTGGATIKRLKLTRGLILAMDNYAAPNDQLKGFLENKISGLVARAKGTTTIENVYNGLEVWYDGFHSQYLGGFVAIVNSSVAVTIKNVKFTGVLGTMYSSGGSKVVPSSSENIYASQIIVNANWSTSVSIESYNMSGTIYENSASATNHAPAVITAAAKFDNVVTDPEASNGPGTASVGAPASYVNRLATKFKTNVYSGSDTPTQYEGTHNTYVYNYKFLSRQDNFNAFGSKLTQNGYTGYTLKQSYQIGNNYYALYENPNEYSLFVTYIETGDSNGNSGSGRGSVFVSPAGTAYNTTKTSTTAAGLCDAQLWQLDVDNAWSTASGAMGYIIQLTNGHYIVIDGGYASEYDARHIYKILKENNPLEGNPVVDGWFITHLHDDHFGALIKFASIFANDVDIKGFYYNFPSDTVAADADGDDEGINTENIYDVTFAMSAWPSAQLYSKIHAGQTFGFNGMTATVLATHESVSMYYYDSSWHANSFYNGNDTSLVVKYTFFPGTSQEQVFMSTGDACTGISTFLNTAYAEADLQADIIQVSHHGWKGITAAVYEKMDKSSSSSNKQAVYLWPQDIIGYSRANDTYYYSPTVWNGYETQQGSKTGGNFGYLYTISQSNSLYGESNYFIRTRAKEVIPAYKDHVLAIPYRANSNYSTTYWTSSNNTNIQSVYNTKKNNAGGKEDKNTGEIWDKWDGSASGQTASVAFEVDDWWKEGAEDTYDIDTLQHFYEFVRIAKTNNFSGKTINLNINVKLNAFDGILEEDEYGALVLPDDLKVWTPIPSFAGTFNGNDHIISGLYAYVPFNSTSAPYGGFIKALAGGTMKNLAFTRSAVVFMNTAGYGTASFVLGGIVGQATGTATIQDCTFDVNVYAGTNAHVSFAGVLASAASGATANLTRVTFSGEIATMSTDGYKANTMNTGSHLYGPMGILGHNCSEATVNLTDVKFVGTRVVTPMSGSGKCFSADIYDASHTNGTVNLSGTNYGGTSPDAAPLAAPTESAQPANDAAVVPGTNAPAYVYVPQLDKVLDVARANQVNPVFSQQTDVANSKTNVRIVGTITREAAKRAYTLGFKLTIVRSSDGRKAVACTSQYDAYQSINANGSEVTAEELGGEYIYAMVLNNLPATGTYTIYAQTRFLDQSGVEHFGGVQTITVVNGVIQ